jgi:hypothetical protein
VAFVTVLFVLLVATHGVLGYPPVASAAVAAALAFGLGWIVDRRVSSDEDEEDEITVETKLDVAPHE